MAAADRELITQAEFARRQDWNRSTVTRLKHAGRLVMEGVLVDVEATLARLGHTVGGRDDVAERHAAERAAKAGSVDTAKSPRGGETRADAQARKEAAAADLLEIELAQKRGTLIPKEDVDAALKAFAAATRARLDVLADQLAPILAPVADMAEVHALLAEHARGVLAAIADDMQRAEAALTKGE
jgi:hypothetical protein